MKKFTTEQINAIIDEAVKSASEKISCNFVGSYESYSELIKQVPELKGSELYFATITTSQVACADILRETLMNVLCG